MWVLPPVVHVAVIGEGRGRGRSRVVLCHGGYLGRVGMAAAAAAGVVVTVVRVVVEGWVEITRAGCGRRWRVG